MLDSTNPDQVRDGARRPARPHRRRGVQQVRLAPSRPTRSGAPTSRRSRDAGIDPAAADRGRHRPGQPARRSRPARPATASFNADPRRRRPLLRADRVRPGAERAGRRRHRRAARRGRGGLGPARRRTTRPTPGSGSAPRSPAPRRCATSWCWSTPGSGLAGFADWAEQLIAESTGKQGTGLLPVVVADDSRARGRAAAARRRPSRAWPTTRRRPDVDAGDHAAGSAAPTSS